MFEWKWLCGEETLASQNSMEMIRMIPMEHQWVFFGPCFCGLRHSHMHQQKGNLNNFKLKSSNLFPPSPILWGCVVVVVVVVVVVDSWVDSEICFGGVTPPKFNGWNPKNSWLVICTVNLNVVSFLQGGTFRFQPSVFRGGIPCRLAMVDLAFVCAKSLNARWKLHGTSCSIWNSWDLIHWNESPIKNEIHHILQPLLIQ